MLFFFLYISLQNSSRNLSQISTQISKNLSQKSTQISRNLSQNYSLTSYDQTIRSGKLLRMRLINFMCHENLVINFHNRINLLIGNNGSGKSAILTALVIGLGSNARITNRSKNIKRK